MKRKRIISILLLLAIVLGEIASFPNISSAEPTIIDGVAYYDYREFVQERIRKKHKMPEFETPVPIFTIEANGKKVLVEPDEDMQPGGEEKPYSKADEVPLLQYTDDEGNKKDFVVPVGTEIKLDASPSIGGRKSLKHPRGNIIRYDWQIGKGYNEKTKKWEGGFDTDEGREKRGEGKWEKNQTPSFKVTEPGDYFIFLNVMDDFDELAKEDKEKGIEPFRNWSENGNWRVSKTVEEAKREGVDKKTRIIGWYFTVARIRVVEPNLKLPNYGEADRIVTDDSGVERDRIIVEDKDGKKMISLEEAEKEGKEATPLKPGETYTVKMWMQNEMPPEHDTKNKGIKLNRYVAYFNDKWSSWDWSDTVENGGGIKSLNYSDSIIPAGKTAYYEWKYTVPNQNTPEIEKEKVRLAWKIPDIKLYKEEDNMNPKDDYTHATFPISKPNLRLPNYGFTAKGDRFVTDNNGKKQDRMIVLNKDGKRMISEEEAKRTGKKATPLKSGETYTVKMWMQNMTPPKHDTVNKGIKLNRYVAYFNGKWNNWDWSDTVENGGGIKSLNYSDSIIPAGKTAYYEWKYTVPNKQDKKEKIRLAWKIPDTPEYRKDNSDLSDDYTHATFPMAPEDMLMDQNVILLDNKGKQVDYVQPYQHHTVIFRVWKNIGKTPVKNPNTTINIELEDGAGIKTTRTITHSQILNYDEYVEFRVSVTPTTPWLRAYAVIDRVHHEKGVNDDLTNDAVEKIFATELNLAVSNFTATPQLKQINKFHEKHSLSFNYTLTSTADVYLTGVPVEIRLISPGYKKLYRFYYNFAPHESITDNFADVFDLYPGEYTFEIEINPPPRTYKEFKKSSSNPYDDNIDRTTVKVIRTLDVDCMECKNSGPRNENKWEKTFKMRQDKYIVSEPKERWICTKEEWVPEEEVCHTDNNGHTNCYTVGGYYTCVDGFWETYTVCEMADGYPIEWEEDISFFEKFKIDKIEFRNKFYNDSAGKSKIWKRVNANYKNGETLRAKSGYGFELRVTTEYKTNRAEERPRGTSSHNWYRDIPDTWSDPTGNTWSSIHGYTGTCYHTQSRDPAGFPSFGGGEKICVHIGREGWKKNSKKHENYVCFVIFPRYSFGPWYDRTNIYEFEERDSFGKLKTRKVFFNENAKNQIVPVQVITDYAYMLGLDDDEYAEMLKNNPDSQRDYRLQDCRKFYIKIDGGYKDELRTQIYQ